MMQSVIFRGCRRCCGDLTIQADGPDVYYSCIQCGYYVYLDATGKQIVHHPTDTDNPISRPTLPTFATAQRDPSARKSRRRTLYPEEYRIPQSKKKAPGPT